MFFFWYPMAMANTVRKVSRREPSTLIVGSLPHAVSLEQSLRSEPQSLQQALEEFGGQLVMKASDHCRVLPHILHLIGKGGEHVVFEDVRFPNYVLKVDFIESLSVLYAQAKGEEAVVEETVKLNEKARLHNERLKRLQAYFAPGCVPLETVAVKNIPLSESVVLALMHDRNLDIPKHLTVPPTMPALCTIQRRFILPKTGPVDLYSSYAELNRTILPEYYADGHRLLASPDTIGPEDRKERTKIILYIYPSLKQVVPLMESDADFRTAVGEYVRQAMSYSVDTNEIIDMAGGGNVVMVKAGDAAKTEEMPEDWHDASGVYGWQPFLMDALSPPELNFDLIRQASLLIKHGQEVDLRMKANALNVINYVRFANALAMLAGINDRLDVDGMTVVTADAWRKGLLIEKYLDVYTPKKTTDGSQ